MDELKPGVIRISEETPIQLPTKLLWALVIGVVLAAFYVFTIRQTSNDAYAMSIQNHDQFQQLVVERQRTLNDYYGKMSAVETKLDGMQSALNRIEAKMDKK